MANSALSSSLNVGYLSSHIQHVLVEYICSVNCSCFLKGLYFSSWLATFKPPSAGVRFPSFLIKKGNLLIGWASAHTYTTILEDTPKSGDFSDEKFGKRRFVAYTYGGRQNTIENGRLLPLVC